MHFDDAGHEQAIIFFRMRRDNDVVYEWLNDDLALKRAVAVADFHRDSQPHCLDDVNVQVQ